MYTITINGQTVSLPENVKVVFTAKGLEVINPEVTCLEIQPVQTPVPVAPVHQVINTTPLAQTVRNGNGHARAKQRPLSDTEKDHIRRWFIALNGEIRPDSCVRLLDSMKRSGISDVTIFQITGMVCYLHGKAMSGLVPLRNFDRYLTYLQSHRNLWATYNSSKYEAMRRKNSEAISLQLALNSQLA